jgi:hypothetical protein
MKHIIHTIQHAARVAAVLTLAMTMTPQTVWADASGEFGSLSWTYDSDTRTLTISGSGSMKDYGQREDG